MAIKVLFAQCGKLASCRRQSPVKTIVKLTGQASSMMRMQALTKLSELATNIPEAKTALENWRKGLGETPALSPAQLESRQSSSAKSGNQDLSGSQIKQQRLENAHRDFLSFH